MVKPLDHLLEADMPVLRSPAAPTHTLPGVSFTSLATPSRGASETALWRIEVAPRSPGAPHELTREEVFLILAGSARATIGETVEVAREGDVIVVPPHVPFTLANDGDEVLRAVCCLPVGGQALMNGGAPFTPPWAE
jgi:mannose-6-phosphate isomerase-like protein (cupin superfamily)